MQSLYVFNISFDMQLCIDSNSSFFLFPFSLYWLKILYLSLLFIVSDFVLNCYALMDIDIKQIIVEAQNRWLRPTEICAILNNYKKFRIAPEPAHMPPSMILFCQNITLVILTSSGGKGL